MKSDEMTEVLAEALHRETKLSDTFCRQIGASQAAALTEAMAGTLTISAEGLDREGLALWLIDRTRPLSALHAVRLVYDAIPVPPPPLPTATWSVIQIAGEQWVLDDDGTWCRPGMLGMKSPDEITGTDWTLLHNAGGAA